MPFLLPNSVRALKENGEGILNFFHRLDPLPVAQPTASTQSVKALNGIASLYYCISPTLLLMIRQAGRTR